MACVIEVLIGFHEHIIDINLHGFSYQGLKYPDHHPMIHYPSVFHTERHYIVAVQSMWRDEGCFLHVRQMHRNMVSWRKHPETKECHAQLLHPQFDLFVARGSYLWGMLH